MTNEMVTVLIPPAWFLPNPEAGTTVSLTIGTNMADGPTQSISFKTGMCLPLSVGGPGSVSESSLCVICVSTDHHMLVTKSWGVNTQCVHSSPQLRPDQ